MQRRSWLLVLTHVMTFALPVVPGLVILHRFRPASAELSALVAESYSRQMATFDVVAGDDRAGAAGLKRHLDRLAVIRRDMEAVGVKPDDLPDRACSTLAEIAVLAEAGERDARITDASASCRRECPKCAAMDAKRVLEIGARWLKLERGSE
jgi:hypothetical protein